jgi:hypothetical protein
MRSAAAAGTKEEVHAAFSSALHDLTPEDIAGRFRTPCGVCNANLWRSHVLAQCRHGLPVQTICVLLRPAADGEAMTGTLEHELPDGTKHLVFRYNVVRVWELPAAQILERDLATLPLAPITQVAEQELPSVIRRMGERIEREATPSEGDELRAAAFILTG